MNRPRPVHGLLIVWGLLVIGTNLPGPAKAAATELLPNFDDMKLRFGTGKVIGNKGEISTVLPNIPGAPSGWWVTQWTQNQKLSGDQMSENDPATSDPVLGTAKYGFTTPDRHLHVWVYPNGPGNHPVFDLFERGGSLSNGGGSNLFLSAGLTAPVSLENDVNLTLDAKISAAQAVYGTPGAKKSGAVLGSSFAGLSLNFPSPIDGESSVLFLQISLASSTGKARFKDGCTMSKSGRLRIVAGGTLSGQPPLAFTTSSGPLQPLAFDINDYVKRVFSAPVLCISKHASPQAVDLQNISLNSTVLKGFYIGLETSNIDNRPASPYRGQPQGDVEFGLQLSDLQLKAD